MVAVPESLTTSETDTAALRQTLGDLVVASHRLTRIAARVTGSTESPATWRTLSVLQSAGLSLLDRPRDATSFPPLVPTRDYGYAAIWPDAPGDFAPAEPGLMPSVEIDQSYLEARSDDAVQRLLGQVRVHADQIGARTKCWCQLCAAGTPEERLIFEH